MQILCGRRRLPAAWPRVGNFQNLRWTVEAKPQAIENIAAQNNFLSPHITNHVNARQNPCADAHIQANNETSKRSPQ